MILTDNSFIFSYVRSQNVKWQVSSDSSGLNMIDSKVTVQKVIKVNCLILKVTVHTKTSQWCQLQKYNVSVIKLPKFHLFFKHKHFPEYNSETRVQQLNHKILFYYFNIENLSMLKFNTYTNCLWRDLID